MSGFEVVGASATPVDHTGNTAETIFAQLPIPGRWIGANGVLRFESNWKHNNGANGKTIRARFGVLGTTSDPTIYFGTAVSMLSARYMGLVMNRGNEASQLFASPQNSLAMPGISSLAFGTATQNTALTCYLTLTGALANAGDTLTLESYFAEIFRQL